MNSYNLTSAPNFADRQIPKTVPFSPHGRFLEKIELTQQVRQQTFDIIFTTGNNLSTPALYNLTR